MKIDEETEFIKRANRGCDTGRRRGGHGRQVRSKRDDGNWGRKRMKFVELDRTMIGGILDL